MLEPFLTIILLIILIIAAYTDLKTFEVPDWLNYMGIAIGIGSHIIYSAQEWSYWPLLSSLIGFGIAFAISCLMFYTGQWGGGDAKLLMAVGAIIGFEANKLGVGTNFLINLLFIGAIWGIFWSILLAAKHSRKVWKTFCQLRRKENYARMHLLSTGITLGLIIISFFVQPLQIPILVLALICFLILHLTIFMKSVELSAMQQFVTPDKLTEGDWLVNPVIVGKIILNPPKLGLEKKHLKLLLLWQKQKKISKVLVKYGVPFTPAFLLAFIATIIWGNLIFAMAIQFVL